MFEAESQQPGNFSLDVQDRMGGVQLLYPFGTGQEWAEVCFVPNWAGHGKQRADYRFLAIREKLRQLELGDGEQLPFPTAAFGAKGRYKLFGVVTNRALAGDQVIWWSRERCGKS